MNILIVGAGGAANTMIDTFTRMISMGDSVTIMDGDRFEERNASRQVFCVPGENKASVLAGRMKTLGFPFAKAEPYFLVPGYEIEDYNGYHIIFSLVDNNDSRILIREIADETGALVILAGNETDFSNAFVYRRDLPRIANPFLNFPNLVKPDGLNPGGSCQQATHVEEFPQTIVANHMSGSLALLAYSAWKDFDTEEESLAYMPYQWTAFNHTMEVKNIQPSQINED
jgi:hypothetical protein